MDLSTNVLLALSYTVLAAPLLALVLSLRGIRYSLTLGSGVSLVAALFLAAGAPEQFPLRFDFIIDFYADALSVYFILLVDLIAIVASWYVDRQDVEGLELGEGRNPRRFRALFGAFHVTLLLTPMVNDLFVLWLIVELTTVVSVVLLMYGASTAAAEAGWKYLYVTIPGLILTFVGTTLLASALPVNSAVHWSNVIQVVGQLDPSVVKLAFLFVLLGYGAKAGLAPLHTWLPDVHGEAPSAVSALLSGVLLKVALFATLRWIVIANLALGGRTFTSGLFLAFGLLSLGIATLAILKPNPFKRVLAYHSLEHMGIIAFGLGIGSPLAVFGALLHALYHGLTKMLMFLTFGDVKRQYGGARIAEENIRGALKATPASGGLLALGGLSLVGSPPFNLFLSELIILWAAIRVVRDERSVVLVGAVGVFVLSITLIFGGLISHLSKILLDVPPEGSESLPEELREFGPLYLVLLLLIILGLWIPALGPFDIPGLLNRSTCIILEGSPRC